MVTAFKKHIAAHFPALADQKILVACSGGLDSIVLLHLLQKIGFTLGVAHCNFKLRGAHSDADLSFVETIAANLGVQVFTTVFDTKTYAKTQGVSTQVAARELRYQWFYSTARANGYDRIATGHHADDDLETFFINLSRVTGLRGLTGIASNTEQLIRPLLPFSRAQIMQFAKKEELFWREDSSNSTRDYLRNKLRLDVIPAFKGVNKTVLQNFQQTQQHLKESQALLEDYITLVTKLVVSHTDAGYEIDIKQLQALPNTNTLLFELLYSYGFTDFKAIASILESEVGKKVLSKQYVLHKDRNHLVLTTKEQVVDPHVYCIDAKQQSCTTPIKLNFTEVAQVGEHEPHSLYVDAGKLTYPLKVRAWRLDDVFHPFGMKGKKKLTKFFKDEKLSLLSKNSVWVLESGDEIVWVIGLRPDDRYKVTSATNKVLKIQWNT
ncbi:tRNA lysidine(34) synthetase TilS [Flavobacteriaceae bacterium]|nr:tRNA lysidine(34) synthetase TilS [Flavobacteriaceae bacterium]MDA9283589.1 tRNA lysidine(34) synthetase TilS [Flavobacteriaceae bacterium]MDA9780809.1 tRNA lysidine(34) synthetase TilS [Flavobacteriaceae bacterium]